VYKLFAVLGVQEMDCLEENLDELSVNCQKVVREYVEQVDEDPEIDEIFARSCAPFWDKHCQVCHSIVGGVAWRQRVVSDQQISMHIAVTASFFAAD